MTTARVKQLFTHPIKGLTPQAHNQVYLQAGHGIPGDRAFALMFNSNISDNASFIVPWMKKQNFAMQADWAGLAALDCNYQPQSGVLTIKRQGVELLRQHTNTTDGRNIIGASLEKLGDWGNPNSIFTPTFRFFTGYLAAIYPSQTARHPDRGELKLVGDGSKTRYRDREPVHLSLVSQATLDQLSAIAGNFIDVRRFRPNVLLEEVPVWAEFDWVGKEIQLGKVRLEITAPINRCLNIDVNPDTGQRDIPLLSLLQQHFQHKQIGVLAKVITDGTLRIGDTLTFAP